MFDDLREYLREYVDGGIWLFPLNAERKPLTTLLDDQHKQIEPNHIKSYAELVAFAMEPKHEPFTQFGFRPDFSNLIVIDLDNSPAHANKINGIECFLKECEKAPLSPKTRALLADFPHNFPCHVVSPNNGIHLYFKADFVPKSWEHDKVRLDALNIEIKRNTQVTAAGSVRDGKTYYMNGYIENAPQLTFDIMQMLGKPKPPPPKPMPQRFRNNTEPHAKWCDTPDGVIDKALALYGNLPANDFVSHAARMFAAATDKDGFYLYTIDDAILAIENTSIHQARKEKHHTKASILWNFNKIRNG